MATHSFPSRKNYPWYVFLKSTLIFLVLTVFQGCHSLGDVKVIGLNFQDEIQLAQNLVFTFNRDIVKDTDLNDWKEIEYVHIEPKVPGVFKWSAKNELVFSPKIGFLPATNYKATLVESTIRSGHELKDDIEKQSFEFHTPYLQADKIQAYWAKSLDGKPEAKVKIDFNYPIQEAASKQLVQLALDDKNAKFEPISTPNDEKLLLSVQNAPQEREDLPLEVNIEKGLKMVSGAGYLKEKVELQGTLYSPFVVKIVDSEVGYDQEQGFIKIITSQQISAANLEEAIEIEPKVNFQTELIENGFIVKGVFNQWDAYTLTIKNSLKGVLGAKLEEDFRKDLYFGEMQGKIEFTNKKGLYLSSKGNRNIGIKITNIPKVNLKVVKLYENNILPYLRNNRYSDYEFSETGVQAFNYGEDVQGIYSDVILDKVLETGNLPKIHGVSMLNLPIPEQKKLRGVYLININSNDQYYQNATKLVSVSDLGIIAKQSLDGDELMVFVNSIIDTKSQSDVEIKLISTNNQEIATGKTNGDGILIFENLNEKIGNFKLAMVTAQTDEDFNYMLLEDTRVETSRFEIEGKRRNKVDLDAFIYGDRDIYRPGETIHLNTVIRTSNWEVPEIEPVLIKILLPNGREFRSFYQKFNENGAVSLSIPLGRAAVTGNYTVEVFSGNNQLLNSKSISVEEFMPDRIKVAVTANDAYRLGEMVHLEAVATNLFGPPASDRNYEMDFSLKRKTFKAKGFENYTFEVNNDTKFENELRQGITDDNGLAKQDFILKDSFKDIGLLEGKVFVTVFDETGRPLNRVKSFDVFTQNIFYGIGLQEYYVGTHAPLNIPLAAVSTKGLPSKSTAIVEIFRIEYQNVPERLEGGLRFNSKKIEKLMLSKNVSFVAGKSNISFVPKISGEYEVRIRDSHSTNYCATTFYAYGYGNTTSSSFEVNNEGQVLMEFDKKSYEIGDNAKVLLKSPFKGKILVSIEKDKVLKHFYVDTDEKSAEISIKVTEEMLPNAFVSATLIRAMNDSDIPLTVAHGFASMSVEKPSGRLPIEIIAAKESRSNKKQKIRVKTKANTELTIAVVDEGILQLKNYQTPDIFNHFYQKQALEVASYDLYQFLFPEIGFIRTSTGGDGYDLEKRVNPLSNGRNKLVAVWSGIIQTGFDGEAEFEVDIPQFSGDLRVMVVAYKGDSFGSASTNMKVKDPVVISSGVPKFMSPNDEVIVPITLTNTTKMPSNAVVQVNFTGGLVLQGQSKMILNIPAGKEIKTNISVKAPANIGLASMSVVVNAFKEKFTEKTELTIRPSTSLLKNSFSGVILAGKTADLNFQNTFMPGSAQASLLISKSPLLPFAKHMDYLLSYPHGCIEQTISKAFPQIYFADFAKTIAKNSKALRASSEDEWNPRFNVQEAIRKIESMQLPNGAMVYWQGGEQESWWGSVFAAHFLLEAKKAAYEVNEKVLSQLLNYLNSKMTTKELTESQWVLNEDGSWNAQVIASHEIIYSLYVLAISGNANQPMMNYFKANASLLSLDEKYMLATSYAQIGDETSFNQLLPKSYVMENTRKQNTGSFASPIRNLAISLNSLIESNPNHLQIPQLARILSQAVQANSFLSTQESVFSFLALGKIARKNAGSAVSASLLEGKKVLAAFNGTDVQLNKGIAGKMLTLTTKGKGNLYYFAQQEGLSANSSFKEEDNFLKVRRQLLDRNGVPIQGILKQNQLVVIKVTVSSTLGNSVENVVVTDMLPAAFEIENPRLNEDRNMTWIKNATNPEHFDIRDDRINFYTTASAEEKSFYYLVRVVAKGNFTIGAVSADAMYNAEFRSYSGGGTIRVD